MQDLLKKLVSIENITDDIDKNKVALQFCQDHLKKIGIDAELLWHNDHPSLEWGAKPEVAKFLFNTHIDVVPGPKSCFSPVVNDDKMFGRGVADTKAMVAVFLSLTAAQYERAAAKGVRFVLVSDEEIGGDATRILVSKLPGLKFALFGEPTHLSINNEAKGIMQVRIKVNGKNSHGSRTWDGKNAIIDLSECLHQFLVDNPLPQKYTWETTYNFSQIKGGTAINQVPATCELDCDIRYKPGESVETIVALLEKYFGQGSVEVLRSESPIFTDSENAYLQLLTQALTKNGATVKFTKELGSSDARHCTKIGVPAAVFGPIGDGLHQDGEWLELASLDKAKSVVEDFLTLL